MPNDPIKIGTRGSDLALWQAGFVSAGIKKNFPEITVEIVVIQTTGDKILDTALSKIGDKGLFTKQIETALISGEIDMAVHSLKDLPTTLPDGLEIGATLKRELANDVLISDKFSSIAELPSGAVVATGSLRRKSQLLNYRPDIRTVEIRGNVPTRLSKYRESGADALILAFAGLHRLGFDNEIKETIDVEIMLPAVGQGAVAVEVRSGDEEVSELAASINDAETQLCTLAERSLLRMLEGGCHVPIGAFAQIIGDEILLKAMVGSLDGTTMIKGDLRGLATDAEKVGETLAAQLISQGAKELISDSRK